MAEYFRDNGKHAVGRPQESDGEGVEESSRDVSEVAASPGWRRVLWVVQLLAKDRFVSDSVLQSA